MNFSGKQAACSASPETSRLRSAWVLIVAQAGCPRYNRMRREGARFLAGLLVFIACAGAAQTSGQPRIALRVEHFTVPPATGPIAFVQVHNLLGQPYEGTVRLELPEGWQRSPASQPVSLMAHETKRIPFAIEKASNLRANRYAVKASALGAGTEVVRKQSVVCASAPYFQPKIDGNLKDWGDAIPVDFVYAGKRTTIRTFWTRSAFYIALAVEEEVHQGPTKTGPTESPDAVQFAVALRDAKTGIDVSDTARRYEFLVTGGESRGSAKCYALARPGMPLSVAAERRPFTALDEVDATIAIKRKKKITYYECALPFEAMPEIRPSEGREFCFSVLVHDPGGTGLRDWGEAAGLWPSQRNPLAWCSWEGVQWGSEPPYDGKIEWGLCSSIH